MHTQEGLHIYILSAICQSTRKDLVVKIHIGVG